MDRLRNGFDALTTEEILAVAAQLEQASLTTLAAISAKRTLRTGVEGINRGARLVAGGFKRIGLQTPKWLEDPLPEVDAPSLEEDLERRKKRLSGLTRDELRHRVIADIARRAGTSSKEPDVVMIRAAQAAAPSFGINPNLAPSALVPALAESFYAKLMEQVRRKYDKMSSAQKEEIHRRIDASLERLSPDDRRKIQRALNLDRLSGRTLMSMLSASGGVLLVTSLVSGTGFGAYLALTTIIHAVMTTFLGITVPFAVYTAATSTLSFLLGPVGVSLMLIMAVGFSGRQGQRRIDQFVMAHVVTEVYLAAGPELEPVLSAEERERQEESAAELNRLRETVNVAERLLQEAANREREAQEQIQRLQQRVADLEERGGSQELVDDLTAQIAALRRQVERERREKVEIQEKLVQQQALLERKIRERSQELQRRFEIVYEGKFVVDEYVTRWLARLHNAERRFKAERAMRCLSEGDDRYLRPNARIQSLRTPIYEAGFDQTGRLYFLRENNRLRFVCIGDKNTQEDDLRWLRERFG